MKLNRLIMNPKFEIAKGAFNPLTIHCADCNNLLTKRKSFTILGMRVKGFKCSLCTKTYLGLNEAQKIIDKLTDKRMLVRVEYKRSGKGLVAIEYWSDGRIIQRLIGKDIVDYILEGKAEARKILNKARSKGEQR